MKYWLLSLRYCWTKVKSNVNFSLVLSYCHPYLSRTHLLLALAQSLLALALWAAGQRVPPLLLFLFTASAPRHFCSFLIFSLNYSKFKLKTKARDRPRGFNFQSTFACPCPLGCGPKGALFLNLPVKDLYR